MLRLLISGCFCDRNRLRPPSALAQASRYGETGWRKTAKPLGIGARQPRMKSSSSTST